MSAELLPCPFCGERESLLVEHLEGTIIHPAYQVRCDNCGASSDYNDNDHVAAWNRRAQPINPSPAYSKAIDGEAFEVETCRAIPSLERLPDGRFAMSESDFDKMRLAAALSTHPANKAESE